MKCVFPGCQNRKITARHLCDKHYHHTKYKGELDNYPRMKRKGGTGCITPDGYKLITVNGKRVFEHRHIVEKNIGRKLKSNEITHHKDGDGLNNKLENLVVTNQSGHVTFFHNNKPRVFDWNKFTPKNQNNKCQVCDSKLNSQNSYGLCRKHYGAYWHWKRRH